MRQPDKSRSAALAYPAHQPRSEASPQGARGVQAFGRGGSCPEMPRPVEQRLQGGRELHQARIAAGGFDTRRPMRGLMMTASGQS